MKSVVQRVLAEFIDAGRLGKAELDTAAQEVLEKMEAKVRRGDTCQMRGRGRISSRLPVYCYYGLIDGGEDEWGVWGWREGGRRMGGGDSVSSR